jgi:hypothetical protein
MSEGDASGKQGSEAGSVPQIELEVEAGKKVVVTAEDVKGLLQLKGQHESMSSELAAVRKAAERHGLSPQEFVQNTESLVGLVGTLIEQGVLDENGEIVNRNTGGTGDQHPLLKPTERTSGDPPPRGAELSSVEAIVSRAVESLDKKRSGEIKVLVDTVRRLSEDNAQLIRLKLEEQLKGEFEDLDERDIRHAISVAASSQGKIDVRSAAKQLADSKANWLAGLKKKHAEEFGVNLEDVALNKQLKQGGGGAAVLASGKKISFRPGADGVSPKSLMKNFFKAKGI